jgi:uncharacterized membrane protein YdbT with pleckstrin-like domain
MNRQKDFKPKKTPFIIIWIYPAVISAIAIFIFYSIVNSFLSLPAFVLPAVLLLIFLEIGFFCLQAFVVYKKRCYIFQDDRILQYSGGIFSDSQTELLIKNITHVKRVYPFVEYGIFRTGHIRVEAAGSQESEVHINSVDNVEELMQLIEQVMAENGFNLGREELKYTENPHPLGAFFEVFKGFVVALAVASAVISNFATEVPEITDFLLNNKILLAILFVIIIVPIFTWFVLRFLDLLKREYNIYSNIITYTEGFLNKHYAFIPFKNLSDSATTQTIIDRIFDLYDVKLSVQGSGHEILFKNLRRGREISETLDALIDEHKEETREAPVSSGVVSKQEGVEARPEGAVGGKQKEKSISFPDYEIEFTDDFRININRHFFPLVFYIPLILIGLAFPSLFLTVLFIIFVNFIPLFLQAKFTRFYIKKKGMLSHYKFLTAKDIEFSNEKITGLVIKRNFMDYWFNTATFRFYSIGAGSNLDFVNVDYSDDLAAKIQAKTGVAPKRKVFNIDSEFSFTESLRASFFFVLVVVIVSLLWLFYAGNFLASQGYGFWGAAIPLVLLGVVWGAIYIYQVFYYQRSKLFFYEDVVHFRKGIFFKDFFYVRYDNIKDITTTKYPFSDEGDIRFNIAGEAVVQTQQGKSIQSHSFTIKYVPNIPLQDELIDFILLHRPSVEEIKNCLDDSSRCATRTIREEIPSVKNPAFLAILFLFFPNAAVSVLILILPQTNNILILSAVLLALLDVIVLGAVVLYTKLKKYIIEDNRVVARWGVFYKKQTTVVFGKVDFLNSHKNFLNKILGNGNITVNTIGSSRPELRIKNLNHYQDFYNTLHENYKDWDSGR